MQSLILFLVPLLFVGRGIAMLAAGRSREAKRSLVFAAALGALVAGSQHLPQSWLERIVIALERGFAGAELFVLATWPVRSGRAGPTEIVLERGSSEWKVLALLAIVTN